jgi:quercetin dioxygenase-like cupin family protein
MRMVSISTEIEAVALERVEGQPVAGGSTIKQLLVGRLGLLAEMTLPRGVATPPHTHDHESLCYVVKGQVRATIAGGGSWVLGPGDSVLHPQGMMHSLEALEDTTWIEFKTPPEKPW